MKLCSLVKRARKIRLRFSICKVRSSMKQTAFEEFFYELKLFTVRLNKNVGLVLIE